MQTTLAFISAKDKFAFTQTARKLSEIYNKLSLNSREYIYSQNYYTDQEMSNYLEPVG